MVRRRLLNAQPKTRNGVAGALRRRDKKQKVRVGEVIAFDEDEVLKPLLRGPIHQNFRDDGYIHVSDVIHKCMRKIALSKTLEQPMDPEPLFDSLSLTFSMGDAIHDFIRGKVRDQSPRLIYGGWKCKCDYTTEIGTMWQMRERTCGECHGPLNQYQEVKVIDTEYHMTGSIDLMLLEDGAFLPTEIKSINKAAWEELERPIPDHVIQVLFYWHLLQRAGHNLHDKVAILYAVKDYVFKSPYKEFVLQPSKILHRLDDYIEEACILRDAIEDGGPLPARVCCPTNTAPAAKKCQFREVCFQL